MVSKFFLPQYLGHFFVAKCFSKLIVFLILTSHTHRKHIPISFVYDSDESANLTSLSVPSLKLNFIFRELYIRKNGFCLTFFYNFL